MIGRASIGNPWFFNQIKHFLKTGNNSAMPSLEERVKVVKEHLDFSIRWKGDRVGIVEMRRHYANYFKGIPNFKPIRTQLVTLESKDELLEVLNGIVNQFELELI
jgi:tRNA-dihydrouridine synthase